jgi:hypothetical protein
MDYGSALTQRVANAQKDNPGADSLAQYTMAVTDHKRGSHDAAGKIIHETPKARIDAFGNWRLRSARVRAKIGQGPPRTISSLVIAVKIRRVMRAELAITSHLCSARAGYSWM